jgi:hypothetical protein
MLLNALLADSESPQSLALLALTTLITSAIGAILGSLAGYYRTRAEREAAHRDFHRVLSEAQTTTDAIKRIEQQFARGNIVFAAEIAYRQRQLAEFYGPIYASLKLTVRLWRLLSDGKIGSVRPPVMDLFRAQNEMILKLLQSKFDLVEGDTIPACFARYATAVTLFNFGTRVGDNNNPPDIAGLEEARFPQEFVDYVVETTEELKRTLARLYREAGVHSGRVPPNQAPQQTAAAVSLSGSS